MNVDFVLKQSKECCEHILDSISYDTWNHERAIESRIDEPRVEVVEIQSISEKDQQRFYSKWRRVARLGPDFVSELNRLGFPNPERIDEELLSIYNTRVLSKILAIPIRETWILNHLSDICYAYYVDVCLPTDVSGLEYFGHTIALLRRGYAFLERTSDSHVRVVDLYAMVSNRLAPRAPVRASFELKSAFAGRASELRGRPHSTTEIRQLKSYMKSHGVQHSVLSMMAKYRVVSSMMRLNFWVVDGVPTEIEWIDSRRIVTELMYCSRVSPAMFGLFPFATPLLDESDLIFMDLNFPDPVVQRWTHELDEMVGPKFLLSQVVRDAEILSARPTSWG